MWKPLPLSERSAVRGSVSPAVAIAPLDDERTAKLAAAIEKAGYRPVVLSCWDGVYAYLRSTRPLALFLDPYTGDGAAMRTARQVCAAPDLEGVAIMLLLPRGSEVPDIVNQLDLRRIGMITTPFGRGEVAAMLDRLAQLRELPAPPDT